MTDVRLISSDLNGTLVHQHTMMDMIRVGFAGEPERFEKAKDAFVRQTEGFLGIEETFQIAGPLTKGLSLRTAIEYALTEMRFLNGFEHFIKTLHRNNVRFIINSTGYSITTEVIKVFFGAEYFDDVICNRLIFEKNGKVVDERELSELVVSYLQGDKSKKIYDTISAAGIIEFGIKNENEKGQKLLTIADRLNITRMSLVHIGDTMGDSGGICEVAKHGGIGIAFNYNQALKKHLEKVLTHQKLKGKIFFIDPKSEHSDLTHILTALQFD